MGFIMAADGQGWWIQLAGQQDTGKTRVLGEVAARLREEGRRVILLKHSHHPLAKPGKDTRVVRERGAAAAVRWAADGLAAELPVRDLPDLVAWLRPDWVLAEGGRQWPTPKLVIGDQGAAPPIRARLGPGVADGLLHWTGDPAGEPERAAAWILEHRGQLAVPLPQIDWEALIARDLD